MFEGHGMTPCFTKFKFLQIKLMKINIYVHNLKQITISFKSKGELSMWLGLPVFCLSIFSLRCYHEDCNDDDSQMTQGGGPPMCCPPHGGYVIVFRTKPTLIASIWRRHGR